ncbi:hypothetical protein [Aeromonas enteropelogenes]|uniref:hypothetical protein n=1 Tax=Aeromonas enteropelogenes TaxID=29489 RepID=UPI003BA0B6F7
MTINIDELTGNETLDELEAALDGLEDGGNTEGELQHSEEHATEPEKKGEQTAPPAAEGEGNNKTSDTNQEDGKQQESEKVLLSKDGKHTIPYDVLEAERAQRQALAEENAQLKAAASEREKLQKVLEKHGIDPNADPDALNVEEIEQLAEDYPEIGKVLTGIANRLNKLQQPQTQQPVQQQQPYAAPHDVQAALQAVPVLKGWMESDADRRTFAVSVDDRLREDPAWKDKPLTERFAEVVKRTKAAFGDPVDPPAKEQKQPPAEVDGKDVDRIPRSPSDIGQSVQHSTEREKFDGMNDEQLYERMSSMTPEQLEALLDEYDV